MSHLLRLCNRAHARRLAVMRQRTATILLLASAVVAAADAAPRLTSVVAESAQSVPVLRELHLTGTVTSPQVAQVSTSVGGLVETVQVDSGDRVTAGETLVELDRELEGLALRQAKAATQEAREQLADARRRLEEGRRLVRDHSIAESEVLSREADVRIAAARVERLEAEERHQAARLRRHTVKAPFAGVVSRKLTAPGEWVQPGTEVVELVDLDQLRLDFQAPQAYFPRLSSQTRVAVRLDALPERALPARITATIPVSDPDARTFTVRVHLDDNDVPMTPGMSAHAVLKLETGRRNVAVSRDALIRYPDGRVTVWVLAEGREGTTVTENQVQTGLTFGGRVEIRSGVQPGQRVVVRGNEALQEGQAVRLQNR